MQRNRHAQTLRQAATLSGRGLHGDLPCTVVLRPAERASGITFVHTPTGVEIPARAEFVGDCSLATSLTRDGVRLQTVEHLLSALMGLGIDHVTIEVDGEELPILDGSSEPWVRLILEAGIRPMAIWSRTLRILKPVEVRMGDKWMRVSPWNGLRLAYTIIYDNPYIGRQSRELTLTTEKYVRELGLARTFCLESDITFMRGTDQKTFEWHTMSWHERYQFVDKIDGKHHLPGPGGGFDLDWQFAYGESHATEPDRRWITLLSSQIQAADVELVAELAHAPATVEQLLAFKAGDFIELDLKQVIETKVRGVPLFDCHYGISNGKYALKLNQWQTGSGVGWLDAARAG
ncbi:MAG: hypothetical protein HGA66_17205 [Holophaga sp.]|nr:hypothetical protein [Holophaga sp.]